MCDRIRETDERIIDLEKDECIKVNKTLENCLNINNRDFRKCKDELNLLKQCMNNKNSNNSTSINNT